MTPATAPLKALAVCLLLGSLGGLVAGVYLERMVLPYCTPPQCVVRQADGTLTGLSGDITYTQAQVDGR